MEPKTRKKLRKTAFFSALFTVAFSTSTAITYFLSPVRTVAFVPPESSEPVTPTPEAPTDQIGMLLNRLSILPGLSGKISGTIDFPKASGSAELSTASIDADLVLSLADSSSYGFALDIEAGLNGSKKSLSAAYLDGELCFDLLGAKYYAEGEDLNEALNHLVRIFGEEAFETPDLLALLGDLDPSMLDSIDITENDSFILFDIGLNLSEGGEASHIYLTTDSQYTPTNLLIEDLTVGDLTVDVTGSFKLEENGPTAVRSRFPSSFEESGYRPIVNSLGLVERVYGLVENPRFGVALEARILNSSMMKPGDEESDYALNLDLEGQVDLVDGAFDANLALLGDGQDAPVASTIALGYRGDESGEEGKAYLSYGKGMNLRMSTLTMDALLARMEALVPSDSPSLIDSLLFNDELKAVAAGEYERVIDAVTGFSTPADNILELGLDLSHLGLGDGAEVKVRIDGRDVEEGFAGNTARLEISGVEAFGIELDACIELTPYSELASIDFDAYDSLDGLPTLFDQVSTLVNEKKAGFHLEGSLVDEAGLGMDELSGDLQFDLAGMMMTGSLRIGEKTAEYERDHTLVLDLNGKSASPAAVRFAFNEKMKGKLTVDTLGGILELATGLLSSDDERWDIFLDPLREMMVDTVVSDLMAGKIAALAKYSFIDSLRVNAESIALTIDMVALGMGGKLNLTAKLDGNGEISSLALTDLSLGSSTLNLAIGLVDYDGEVENRLDPNDAYMDFSSLDLLVGDLLNTASLGTYHFDNGVLSISLLGFISGADLDLDADVRVDGLNVEAYVHLGGLRSGALALVTEGYIGSSRDTYIYYDGRDGRSDLYINNVQTGWLGERASTYKYTAASFLENPIKIIMKDILSLSDGAYDLIAGSDSEPTGEPIAYESIVTAYAYDEANRRFDLGVGLPTLLQSSILSDLTASLYVGEVGGIDYLTRIVGGLDIVGGLAKIELDASLSNIGADSFWSNPANAYATYLSAHGGDGYTA